MWAYQVVRRFLRFVVHVFFRQIEVVGLENIPEQGEGPVIFAGNHPNSLIDPVMIVTTSGRIVHFAAGDKLFRSRLLRPFLYALGAVPIRRRMDHGGNKIDNSAAFDALYKVLAEGHTVGIFPEGLSHDKAQLTSLKTGAARLAFGLKEQHPDLPLCIVPFGLTFNHQRHFRSRVLVQFSTPIIIDEERIKDHADDGREAVRRLTDDIDQGIRQVTINSTSWETLRVLDGVRRLYQPSRIPLQHRVELARRFAMVYEQIREEPKVVQLYEQVTDYMDRLSDLGLSDSELKRPVRLGQLFFKLLARGGAIPLLAPSGPAGHGDSCPSGAAHWLERPALHAPAGCHRHHQAAGGHDAGRRGLHDDHGPSFLASRLASGPRRGGAAPPVGPRHHQSSGANRLHQARPTLLRQGGLAKAGDTRPAQLAHRA